MYIFLGIVGGIASFAGSIALRVNGVFDALIEIGNKGYKIDKETVNKYQKELEEEKNKNNDNNKGLKKAVNIVLLLTPGVNLVKATIDVNRIKKNIENLVVSDSEYAYAFIPMTDEEKEDYAKIEGKLAKLAYVSFVTMKNEDQEFFGFAGSKILAVDHGLESLYYEPVLPFECTLEEVQKLNDATTFSYRLGRVNGKNIAIIGVPNPNSSFKRLDMGTDEIQRGQDFIPMTEEEARNERFTVYPFTMRDETKEALDTVIENIKQTRENTPRFTIGGKPLEPRTDEPVYDSETISLSKEDSGVKLTYTPKRTEK